MTRRRADREAGAVFTRGRKDSRVGARVDVVAWARSGETLGEFALRTGIGGAWLQAALRTLIRRWYG